MGTKIDDPTTWVNLGEIDPILKELIKRDSSAALKKSTDPSTIVSTRASWAPRLQQVAAEAFDCAHEVVERKTLQIPRRDGGTQRAILARPSNARFDAMPLVILIHGGGFVFGAPEVEAPFAVEIVKAYGCSVICLSYRLAPEHKFPTATEDCWDAFTWIAENQLSLGFDLIKGFILGGTSAGGNIAAVLSHQARDQRIDPPLTGCYLNVPLVLAPEAVKPEHTYLYQSRKQNAYSPVLNEAYMKMYTEAYQPDDISNSHIWSPFNWPGDDKTRHAGLPPTYFQVCGLDPLRDEGLMYERALRQDNHIKTRVDLYPGMPHMFQLYYPMHPLAKVYRTDALRGIGWLLGKASA